MGLLTGVSYFFQALSMLISSPTLLIKALIPALVALGLSLGLTTLGASYSDELTQWLLPNAGDGGWLSALISWSSSIMIGLLSFLITPFLVVLVGLPLCEPLASTAHEQLGGAEVEVPFMTSLTSGLTLGLKVALIALLGSLALMLIGLIPPLGLLTAPFTLLVWAPFWLTFDLCEVVHTRANLSFSERSRQLRSHLLSTLSVGLVAALLIAPPFINLVGFPIAVLMGTIHARRLEVSA